MKRFAIPAWGLLAFVVLVGASVPAAQTPPAAPTVDELVQKNIAARGGLEKLRAIKSLRMTGKLHSDGIDIPLVIQIKRPAMARGDATLQGQRFVIAFDRCR